MKKHLSIILSAIIVITCLVPFTAFAEVIQNMMPSLHKQNLNH